MPAPMSMDLRLRIVRAVEGGSSIRAAARRFAVSPSAAIKLMQRVRATGSAARRAMAAIAGRCWSRTRPTCAELVEAMPGHHARRAPGRAAAALSVCVAGLSTIHNALRRIGLQA